MVVVVVSARIAAAAVGLLFGLATPPAGRPGLVTDRGGGRVSPQPRICQLADMEISDDAPADYEPSAPEISDDGPADQEPSAPEISDDPPAGYEPSAPEISDDGPADAEPSAPEISDDPPSSEF
jgi:hypothetical protein